MLVAKFLYFPTALVCKTVDRAWQFQVMTNSHLVRNAAQFTEKIHMQFPNVKKNICVHTTSNTASNTLRRSPLIKHRKLVR